MLAAFEYLVKIVMLLKVGVTHVLHTKNKCTVVVQKEKLCRINKW